MPSNRLQHVRKEFEARILEAEEFMHRCRQARHAVANRRALKIGQLEWAAETSALKMVVASERFFELTMALYVLGARAPSGYRVRRIRRFTGTVAEVCEVFKGDQDFVGWNDPSAVIARAERWFGSGEPFQSTLSAASQLLGYLKKMRNSIAHQSASAQATYSKATRGLYGALPKRVLPGTQLIAPPPKAIPYLVGASLLESAISAYRSIATHLVP